eukprot:761808-Hanusia_phi.AAC.1
MCMRPEGSNPSYSWNDCKWRVSREVDYNIHMLTSGFLDRRSASSPSVTCPCDGTYAFLSHTSNELILPFDHRILQGIHGILSGIQLWCARESCKGRNAGRQGDSERVSGNRESGGEGDERGGGE